MPKVSAQHLADRRRQITSAAQRLFAEKGFSRTSMADVVAASGLSNGAVYHYFPTKIDLMLAVTAGRDGRVDGEVLDEPSAALVDRLLGFFDPRHEAAHARLAIQIWGEAAVLPQLAEVVRDTHVRLHEQFAAALADDHNAAVSVAYRSKAQVCLAALVGFAALVSAGVAVDVDGFRRDLEVLLDDVHTAERN